MATAGWNIEGGAESASIYAAVVLVIISHYGSLAIANVYTCPVRVLAPRHIGAWARKYPLGWRGCRIVEVSGDLLLPD